jgi:hypothetical protein
MNWFDICEKEDQDFKQKVSLKKKSYPVKKLTKMVQKLSTNEPASTSHNSSKPPPLSFEHKRKCYVCGDRGHEAVDCSQSRKRPGKGEADLKRMATPKDKTCKRVKSEEKTHSASHSQNAKCIQTEPIKRWVPKSN